MSSDVERTSCYDASMSGEGNNLINFIATTVEALRDQMATKGDLLRLESRLEAIRSETATKDDLVRLVERLRAEMATKDDLNNLRAQTKDDLDRLATTVRGDFEQVHFRFDTLERVMSTRFGQVETDISRIRSVLYLLVKDNPDMLRLLGQPTPGESRPQG